VAPLPHPRSSTEPYDQASRPPRAGFSAPENSSKDGGHPTRRQRACGDGSAIVRTGVRLDREGVPEDFHEHCTPNFGNMPLCRRGDLNPHALASTRPSSWRGGPTTTSSFNLFDPLTQPGCESLLVHLSSRHGKHGGDGVASGHF
jgi:hypothetical protein